jgi:uncharacterized protein (DUF302 family)
MNASLRWFAPAILIVPLVFSGPTVRAGAEENAFGVFEYVIDRTAGSVEEAANALEAALLARGLNVLAKVDTGTPEGCSYKARVFAVVDPQYANKLMAANRRTAPFGVVDRINVFEDEKGVHVALVNPESVNRTILMDDRAYGDLSRAHTETLREAIATAVPGTAVHREYGETRVRGHIGKTMGVMAGGPFADKVKDEFTVASSDWKWVAARVRAGLDRRGAKWGLKRVYELELTEHETVVFGSTGTPMDTKSFSIVGAGADKTRESFKCPGLAHAAAYPIEVVVARDGSTVKVRLVDTMYRMKMFFEDAGKWAFMKNMGMPGSIHDEIAAQIKTELGPQ